MARIINLLPDPVLDTQKRVTSFYQGSVITLIGLIIFVLLNLSLLFLSIRASSHLSNVQNQAAALEQEIQNLKPTESKLLVFREKLTTYENFLAEQVGFGGILRAFAKTSGVQITSIEYQDGQYLTTIIEGPSVHDIVAFLITLRNNDLLSDFTIQDVLYSSTALTYDVTVRINLQAEETTPELAEE
jgi:hypothetical protein